MPGGNANAYVYAVDPINFNDYSGMCLQACGNSAEFLQPATPSVALQPAAYGSAIQGSYRVPNPRIVLPPAQARAPAVSAPKPRDTSTAMPMANTVDFKSFLEDAKAKSGAYSYMDKPADHDMSLWEAADSANDYYNVGAVAGAVLGCIAGALTTLEAMGVGCLVVAPRVSKAGGIVGIFIGFLFGASNSPYANDAQPFPDADTLLRGIK